MKLMPASRALATMRADVASSVGPPNIMVPRQIGEIFRPLRPSWRYCMEESSLWEPSLRAKRSNPSHCTKEAWIASRSLSSGAHSRDPLAPRNGDGLRLVPQYLEHARRHRDTAPVDGYFGGDEDQAAGGAHQMRFRDQDLADLAGLDEVGVELHGRELRLAGDVA